MSDDLNDRLENNITTRLAPLFTFTLSETPTDTPSISTSVIMIRSWLSDAFFRASGFVDANQNGAFSIPDSSV